MRLLKRRPFYGQFLLQFRRRQYSGGKAVGVTLSDAVPTLLIDPVHFTDFSESEQEALLEHLLKHILHLHPARRKQRHSRHWDLACDLAINPGISGLPGEAAKPQRFRLPTGLAAEEYYSRLLLLPELGQLNKTGQGDQQQALADGKKAGQSSVDSSLLQAETSDDHQYWNEADRTPPALSEQVVRQLVQKAWQRSHGEVPGEIQALVERYLKPPRIPWQQILRQFVASAGRVGKSGSWKRPHRRFGHTTPGIRKQPYLNLVVAVDVSDSTDTHTLRELFAEELVQIARGRQSRLTVLYAGSRIQKVTHFTGRPQVTEVYRGGGFTDLRPVFAYASRMQPRPAALIYLTDGYGPAPEHTDIPTLWVISPNGRKPVRWGLELRLDSIEEQHD